jgi:hypothetical protein
VVERTTICKSPSALRDETIASQAAVTDIVRRFRQWVDVFEQARVAASGSNISPRGTVMGNVTRQESPMTSMIDAAAVAACRTFPY